jgi:hypothetical protein
MVDSVLRIGRPKVLVGFVHTEGYFSLCCDVRIPFYISVVGRMLIGGIAIDFCCPCMPETFIRARRHSPEHRGA